MTDENQVQGPEGDITHHADVGADPAQHADSVVVKDAYAVSDQSRGDFVNLEPSDELAADAQDGKEASLDDPRTEDDAPEEIYSGVYDPVPGVNISGAPITEEITEETLAQFAKYGKVILTNMNLNEVLQIDQILRLRVFVAQKERYDKINKGLSADKYVQIEMEDLGTIYMTEAEQQALSQINDFKRQVAFNHIGDVIEDGETATNRPMVDGNPIMMGLVQPSKNADSMAIIRDELGLSNRIAIPFWSSGLHVRLLAPGALSQISLDTQLGQEKIREAMESAGYSLAAPAVFLNRELADFAIKQFISSTAGTVDVSTMKELITLLDFDQLVTSLAFSLYPKGFPVTRRCINSALNCDGEISDLLNINRMVIVFDERLDEHQKRFMSKRAGLHDIKTIKNYQSKMRPNVSRYIDLAPGIRLKLRVPTIAQYESTATAWLDNMTTEAKALISSNAREEDRQNYLVRAQRVSTVMAYAHWVEALVRQGEELESEPEIVKTRLLGENATPDEQFEADKEIDDFLRDFADSPALTKKFTDALEKFIAAMTLTSVCLPKVHCPKCGEPIDKDTGAKHDHPALVTINPSEFFFTLLRRKIASALR